LVVRQEGADMDGTTLVAAHLIQTGGVPSRVMSTNTRAWRTPRLSSISRSVPPATSRASSPYLSRSPSASSWDEEEK
jgi:hypothetical protein